ncbi:MAG: alpha/beta fold hydrolase [Planctomycetota bacterium]
MRRAGLVFSLPGAVPGGEIRGELTLPHAAGTPPFPWVLQAHGYGGSRDWGPHRLLADRLSRRGVASIRFDFSGDGRLPDGSIDESIVVKNFYSRELEDIGRVCDYGDARVELDPKRRAFVGHSRGGGIGLVHVAERGDYQTAIGWAAMDRILRFDAERLERWRREGRTELRHHGLQKTITFDRSLIDDADENRDRLDIRAAVRRIAVPMLFLHGDRDHALDAEVALSLFRSSRTVGTRLRWIEDCGHSFGGRPDQGAGAVSELPARLEFLLNETVDWLTQHLFDLEEGLGSSQL